jgi:hypothetical protein
LTLSANDFAGLPGPAFTGLDHGARG